MTTLGLDIGGASIKASTSDGWVSSIRFPLWRSPDLLADTLTSLCQSATYDRIALTMTGELCDAFQTKEEGVRRILKSTEEAFGTEASLHIWQTTGEFCDAEHARDTPWETGAANWLALAIFAGQFFRQQQAILIDIGSTTTDIIPINLGVPIPRGRTDPDRLASRELVYHGVRRTPIASIRSSVRLNGIEYPLMRELFATSLDAYLVMGQIVESSVESDTADNRPETIPFAVDRMARMIGSDRTHFDRVQGTAFAEQIREAQLSDLKDALLAVKRTSFETVDVIITSGEGEFLARQLIEEMNEVRGVKVHSLSKTLSPATSRAACAYAVAMLAEQKFGA
ncbi:H4MPT-linked C1 transfer pathway protein [bacterium]|nr:H4MPT-linked C1 transfer pathway protein [bacterium]